MSPFEDLKANLAAMIMPAFVLGNAIAAVLMRHTRSAMLQVLSSDYVRTARAKGLDERVVMLKHALRNALMPIITLGALEFGTLLSGAVLTEQVFTIPGFGKLIVDAVFNRDYAVVQGVVLFTATAYIALNLLADIAYFLVNPRMRGCMSADGDARDRRPARPRRAPAAGALAAAVAPAAARCSASSSSSAFVLIALAAPWIAPYDPLATSWSAIRKAPSAAHWFGTDEIGRDVLSRVDLRRARVAARRRRVGAHLAVARRADRARRGLHRPLDRRADLAHDRRDARDAVPDPRDRARRVPRPEPHQRDDRDRHLGDADLHPAHARAGARRSRSRTTSRRRAPSAIRTGASRCATCCRTSCRR